MTSVHVCPRHSREYRQGAGGDWNGVLHREGIALRRCSTKDANTVQTRKEADEFFERKIDTVKGTMAKIAGAMGQKQKQMESVTMAMQDKIAQAAMEDKSGELKGLKVDGAE